MLQHMLYIYAILVTADECTEANHKFNHCFYEWRWIFTNKLKDYTYLEGF